MSADERRRAQASRKIEPTRKPPPLSSTNQPWVQCTSIHSFTYTSLLPPSFDDQVLVHRPGRAVWKTAPRKLTKRDRERQTDIQTERDRESESESEREIQTHTHTHERERESGTRDIRSRVHTQTRRRTGTHRHACNCVTSVHNGVKSMRNVCSQTLMSAALALLACLVPNRKVL